ncbi:ADP-ribosylglycohydrolase family protein [Candidatus Dependentiae bacterium]|nr:ADP-ribosylglycohydrolase family protein [Candidatus Dependentiae bacterium]
MLGAIIGDIIGSIYKWNNIKTKQFPLFKPESGITNDSILTIAVADAILSDCNYTYFIKKYARTYPDKGYGSRFHNWILSDSSTPYNSCGIGSAIRVSPIGWAFETITKVSIEAKRSSEITHNHPEGIKGAQAIASAIYLARIDCTKKEIKDYIESAFNYNLSREINNIRKTYKFNVSCQGTVPEAIIAFLESRTFIDAIRTAVSIGGDSDTIASITGAIAEAYYKDIPSPIIRLALKRLNPNLKNIIAKFRRKYNTKLKGEALWN